MMRAPALDSGRSVAFLVAVLALTVIAGGIAAAHGGPPLPLGWDLLSPSITWE